DESPRRNRGQTDRVWSAGTKSAGWLLLSNSRHTHEASALRMSEERAGRTDTPPPCPRCKAAQMVEVVSIAPLLDEPGLLAYECPRCGYLSSVLVPAAAPHAGG